MCTRELESSELQRLNFMAAAIAFLGLAALSSPGVAAPILGGDASPGEPVHNVLVVAEGRSGSTLLLGLLMLEKNIGFGISEPWHDFPPERDATLPGLDLPGIFNCSFASNPEVLTAIGWYGQGRHVIANNIENTFRSEKDDYRFRMKQSATGLHHRTEAIKRACFASTVRIVKTIRLHGTYREIPRSLIDSGIRVVHLLRHPISVAESWNKLTGSGRWQGVTTFDKRITMMCRRYADATAALERQVPAAQLLRVRYEDVINDPLTTMERVYRFSGLPFGDIQRQAILFAMNKKHGPQCGTVCQRKLERKAEVERLALAMAHLETTALPGSEGRRRSVEGVSECARVLALGNYTGEVPQKTRREGRYQAS